MIGQDVVLDHLHWPQQLLTVAFTCLLQKMKALVDLISTAFDIRLAQDNYRLIHNNENLNQFP